MTARRIALVIFAAALAGAAAFVAANRRSSGPSVEQASTLSRPEQPKATAAGGPEEPLGKTTPVAGTKPDEGKTVTGKAERTLQPGDDYPGKDDPFLDEEQLDAMLAKNSLEALYAALTPDHRRDLVGMLADRDELRDALARLLPLEKDSELRANMIASTIPRGVFPADDEAADEDDEEAGPDTELADLLAELPEGTEGLELLSRLDVAILADEVAALPLVRKVLEIAGDDGALRLRANELLLKLSSGDAPVTSQEIADAQEYLYSSLGGPGALATYGAEERIRGYMALAAATDHDRTMRFYEEAMALETDPRARTVLQGLLRTW